MRDLACTTEAPVGPGWLHRRTRRCCRLSGSWKGIGREREGAGLQTTDLTGLRVLVVEDEALITMLFEDFLEDLGCQVIGTASRLDDAVEKARTLPMQVAVLDVNLAGQLSYPVAEVLRARDVPFVFATGYGAAALPEALQGVPVLTKPFQQRQLEQTLCAAVTRQA